MVRKELIIKQRPYRTAPKRVAGAKVAGDNAGAPAPQEVFRRTEVKYVLTPAEMQALLSEIELFIEPDRYFANTNCSIYLDNAARYLAVHSLEKPLYKEKIRVRSYNVPRNLDETVFVEIKKKYKGVGNKRRVAVRLGDFYEYLETGALKTDNAQIRRELDYAFGRYDLQPFLYLAYDRHSYCGRGADKGFRLTFDENVRYRTDNLRLEAGSEGEKYFTDGRVIMEAKALDSYPLWFARALSELSIYPTSFSKYGKVCLKLQEDLEKKHNRNIIYRKEEQYV